MIKKVWHKTQNDAPFVAFYDMRAVTFVLPDEMTDVSLSGLQWFILIPRLNHKGSHRPNDSHSKPYLHRGKKKLDLEQELPSLLQCNELWEKQPFVSDFSRLFRHAIGRGLIPYSKINTGPCRDKVVQNLGLCCKGLPKTYSII